MLETLINTATKTINDYYNDYNYYYNDYYNNYYNDYYNDYNTKQSQIATAEQATFLFWTSCIGLTTGFIGIYNGNPGLGISTCVGSLIAMNYWKNPIYGLRRNIDMASVQLLIWLHVYYAFYSPIKLIYFAIQIIGALFYFVSWHYHTPNSLWTSTLCHGATHMCANISLLLFYTLA